MADVRMTTVAENPLCTRLKAKFSGRGIENTRVQNGAFNETRKETPAVRQVKNIVDPFEETGEFVRREVRTKENVAPAARTVSRPVNRETMARGQASAKMATPFADGTFKDAYARGAAIRMSAAAGTYNASLAKTAQFQRQTAKKATVNTAYAANAATSEFKKQSAANVNAATMQFERQGAAKTTAKTATATDAKTSRFEKQTAKGAGVKMNGGAAVKTAQKRVIPLGPTWWKNVVLGHAEEKKISTPRISVSFVIGVLLFAVILMMVIFSFAEVNAFKKEISNLQVEKEQLVSEIEEITLEIDLENDIRVIEQVATEEFGMVKSNRVESKYISVAAGEKIVVPEGAVEEANYGIFSTMMSTVTSNWDKLMEYID